MAKKDKKTAALEKAARKEAKKNKQAEKATKGVTKKSKKVVIWTDFSRNGDGLRSSPLLVRRI